MKVLSQYLLENQVTNQIPFKVNDIIIKMTENLYLKCQTNIWWQIYADINCSEKNVVLETHPIFRFPIEIFGKVKSKRSGRLSRRRGRAESNGNALVWQPELAQEFAPISNLGHLPAHFCAKTCHQNMGRWRCSEKSLFLLIMTSIMNSVAAA